MGGALCISCFSTLASAFVQCWRLYPVCACACVCQGRSCFQLHLSQTALSVTRDSCHSKQGLPYWSCEEVIGKHYFWGNEILRFLGEDSCIVWNTRVRPSD
jgi:hypothetical protein